MNNHSKFKEGQIWVEGFIFCVQTKLEPLLLVNVVE
jgi:hypothetical protein